MRRLQRLARSTRGAALLLMAVTLGGLAAVAIIAIDISRMLVARAELQNAADAGALAGARLFMDEPNPPDSDIHAHAKEVAGMNQAFAEGKSEPIPIANIETVVDSDPAVQSVTVTTSSVVSQYFTGLISLVNSPKAGTNVAGMEAREARVKAKATARVGELCDAKCLKPWSIPDRWDDQHVIVVPNPEIPGWKGNKAWDSEEFTDQNGNKLWDPGEPVPGDADPKNGNANGTYDAEFYHPLITGYRASVDHGLQLLLKSNNSSKQIESQYFAIDLPDESGESIEGADWYRWNIANCNPYPLGPGDWVWTENGYMDGPTRLGMRDLIDQDPDAYYDEACKCILGSDPKYELSPRIGLIPIHDPRIPLNQGKKQLQITKIAAFFIEEQQGDEVLGRFLKIQAVNGTVCPPGETSGGFLWHLSLVE